MRLATTFPFRGCLYPAAMSTAVCPGSFDPVTNGHLDIILRAAEIFNELIVLVAVNPQKDSLFSVEERVFMLQESLSQHPQVKIDTFTGLLVSYMEKRGAQVIVRGLRAVSDFEYEFQMAMMNNKLSPNIETTFLMASTRYSYLSSSIIKEVASLDACIEGLVPPHVEKKLLQRIQEKYRGNGP